MCSTCKTRRVKRLAKFYPLVPFVLAPVFLATPAILTAPQPLVNSSGDAPAIGILVGMSKPARAAAPSSKADKTKWTCPMHPHYIADEFGTCPICGMDLVKLDTGGAQPGAAEAETRTVITVAPEVVQNIGVRLGKAEKSRFGRSIRSYGIVHENERLTTEYTARVEGWVQDLRVTAVGDEVKKGDPLFKLYSPRLIVAQGDYIRSRGARGALNRSVSQLRAFGVQAQALKQIEKAKQPLELVPFFADRTGTVVDLNLKEGTYLKRGMLLTKIQDYSTVWLRVSVAEKDLSFISKGTSATVTFPNIPDKKSTAKVDYVYPTIDSKTRTGQVRLVIPNPDGIVRPGSYADVVFEVGAKERVAVKSEAVLRGGNGAHIVVSLGQGRFEPRAVRTGLIADGWTEITQGVKAGEDIVLSGQFLLDSESTLRESFRKLQRLQLPLSLLKLTRNQQAMVDHLVDAALYLHEALIDGYDLEPTAIDPAISIRDFLWPRFKDTKLAFVLDDAIAALREAKKAKTENEVRDALGKLVTALRPWLIDGAPDHYRTRKVVVVKDKASGRLWLQMLGRALNPYSRGKSELVPWPEKQPKATDSDGGDRARKRTAISDEKRTADVTGTKDSNRGQ